MIAPQALILIWFLSGIVAWNISKSRQGCNRVWLVLGQLLGPFSIPLVFLMTSKSES